MGDPQSDLLSLRDISTIHRNPAIDIDFVVALSERPIESTSRITLGICWPVFDDFRHNDRSVPDEPTIGLGRL